MQFNEGSIFCSRCGARVGLVAEQPAADVSPKSRLAVSLLAWFVGEFGAHRFYAGKIRTAVVMLVGTVFAYAVIIGAFIGMLAAESDESWWIAFSFGMVIGGLLIFAIGIWSLVDFIIALTGNLRDGEGKVIKKW
jgi:TM2 domain-containing membrane protein YozV